MENLSNHDEIMHSLGVLESKAEGIIRRLDLINGSVLKHNQDIQDLQILNAERKGAWKVTVVIAGAISTLIYFVLNKLI